MNQQLHQRGWMKKAEEKEENLLLILNERKKSPKSHKITLKNGQIFFVIWLMNSKRLHGHNFANIRICVQKQQNGN